MKIGKFLQLLICTLNVPVTKSYLKRRETDILKYPTSNVFSGLHLTWEFWITPNKRRIQIGATRWLWNLTTILQDFLIKKSNTSMTKFWLEIREIKWGVLNMPIYFSDARRWTTFGESSERWAILALQVVEFSSRVCKIRKIFAEESTYPKEIFEFWGLDSAPLACRNKTVFF